MLDLEVFVSKLLTVNTLSTSAIAARKITTYNVCESDAPVADTSSELDHKLYPES